MAFGKVGPSRHDSYTTLVATPAALRDNVKFADLEHVETVVRRDSLRHLRCLESFSCLMFEFLSVKGAECLT